MKSILLAATVLAFTSLGQAIDNQYFELDAPQVREIKTETLSPRAFSATAIGSANCAQDTGSRLFLKTPGAGDILGELNIADLILDQIINMGKKVWNIVEAGKPVVNLKTDVATALPAGAKCWMDLQTWNAPVAKTYSVTYKNLYGVQVVSFTYRVIFVAGGSVNGQGAYIGYAAIEPSELNVAWGFKFNAESSAPTIYNMGTKADPVAGMNLQMSYSIDTIMNHIQASQSYFINGKGQFQVLE